MVLLLGRKGVDATVTLAHSRTADLAGVCREADIIIAAAGSARMITADHVKPGAAVVDVGVSRTEAGIVGDVDFDAVQAIAGAITPMPGGTGPMTIACLLENTLAAARMQGAFPESRARVTPGDASLGSELRSARGSRTRRVASGKIPTIRANRWLGNASARSHPPRTRPAGCQHLGQTTTS